ncbi:hypothetical protein C1T31_04805 [Hanstruepera neustonica]|uniref:Glycosyltransferase 2-like domain-containing protein n=1 Tax=Hanstruepera neustonica TaxID=1445657 RepID=A0A2K1E081_9FLAO|nr:glycosyltransferase family 2 protein [Hanstruepera neustonica]PNQ73661.1 hypothetical protein C1T31_04805 [Hanstruepera neustonica]
MDFKNEPLVSICIPTYNGSSYIEETLLSALNQTYKNIEIIITDDKSSDNTVELCKNFASKDNRIKVFENDSNLGLIGNWTESVEKASSNWIKFLFQDDLLQPTCVEKMIHAALNLKVDLVICNRQYFFEENFDPKIKRDYEEKLPKTELIIEDQKIYTPKETAKQIAPHFFNNCIGEPPTLLFNKAIYSKEDFSEEYFQLVDYDFILNKILAHNFVFISEKLLKFRVHSKSESMKNSQSDKENKKAFDRYLYIHYYEKILLCHKIINNPVFNELNKLISNEDVEKIKNWFVIKSYRRHGFKNVFPFYKSSKLSDFILSPVTSSYSTFKYKRMKISHKKYRKKYKI